MVQQYGFFVDMNACYGCRTCSMACKSENETPNGVLWRNVKEFHFENPNEIAYITMGCNHCDDPQCLKICPAQAYKKREDGIVVQNHEQCIGCQMCVKACPYQVPVFNKVEGKTSKCDFCASRIDDGLIPRCVESCPASALQFGDIEDLRKQYGADLSQVEERYGFPDHTISQPNVVIVLADNRKY